MRIDLHAHSSASDGTLPPGDLVRAAANAGLDVVAITDHDTTLGWAAAQEALVPGLTLVPGAEVSCAHDGVSLHVLAYLFDPLHPGLAHELSQTRTDRVPRAQEMVRRLAADGYPITWADVRAQVGPGGTVGRPHLADALVKAGACVDRDEAFARLLHSGSTYFVRHRAADPFDLVRLVADAGGVTVFAHPGAHQRGPVVGDDIIEDLAAAGLAGLEVDHPDHDAETRNRLRALAGSLGLLCTGASDFHGSGKAQHLGQETTDAATYRALIAGAKTGPLRARGHVGGP